jgi:hypothetical protein
MRKLDAEDVVWKMWCGRFPVEVWERGFTACNYKEIGLVFNLQAITA